jgi:hypothetical protein
VGFNNSNVFFFVLHVVYCSVRVFTREQVKQIVDYVTHTYYRHFQLYKCIYTPYSHVHLVQRNTADVDEPKQPRALSEAFLHKPTQQEVVPEEETAHLNDESLLAIETA